MALWRDPLDDLIEDLERAVPAKPVPNEDDFGPRLEELQWAVCELMYARTPEEVARVKSDPRVQKVVDQLARQFARNSGE
jgi:hypothetical protein